MANRVRRRVWMTALTTSATVILAVAMARAQQPDPTRQPIDSIPFWGGEGTWANQFFYGQNKPSISRQGDWAEVIMANGRWVVIQNAQGQQFPVAFETIRQFVIRWPARLDIVGPDALVEATGVDTGTNTLQTDHLDVYEGSARTMVTPAIFNLFGANRVLTPLDANQAPVYGTYFPFAPTEAGIPARIHVVGNIMGFNPLRLGVQGNNWVNVLPSSDGLNVTQVTPGTPAYVKKGDLVYFVPEQAGPKSLTVSRLILYKKIPVRAYTGD
jgi:hypothetical protein